MQKQFISIASHELRNPIQPIIGLVEVLQSKIKDDTQKQLLDVISRNAKKLKQLAEDVLDVAKIESDTLHLNSEGFDLNDSISNIIIDYDVQIHGQGIKLKYEIMPIIPL